MSLEQTPEQTKPSQSDHGYLIEQARSAGAGGAAGDGFVVRRPDGTLLPAVYQTREAAQLAADGDYCMRVMSGATSRRPSGR